MEPKRILPVVAALVAVSAGVAALRPQDIDARNPAATNPRAREARVVELPDGGVGYAYPVSVPCAMEQAIALLDGGVLVQALPMICTEYEVSDVAPCVRRPAGAPVEACLRRQWDGQVVDFGELNRFLASEAVGNGCEPVACGIVGGDNEVESDAEKVQRAKGRKKDGGA